MKHTQRASGILVSNEGKILVVSHDGITWRLPGSYIGGGEVWEETERLVRARSERSRVENIRVLGTFKRYAKRSEENGHESTLTTVTIFLSAVKHFDKQSAAKHYEHVKWVEPSQVSENLTQSREIKFYQSVQDKVMEYIIARQR